MWGSGSSAADDGRLTSTAAPFVPRAASDVAATAASATTTSSLPATAAPFVPGGGVSRSPAGPSGTAGVVMTPGAASPSPMRLMKSAGPVGTAGETPHRAESGAAAVAALTTPGGSAFVPSPEGGGASGALAAAVAAAAYSGESDGAVGAGAGAGASAGSGSGGGDPMVEVLRGGTVYFVPESEAIARGDTLASGGVAGGASAGGPDMSAGAYVEAAPRRRTFRSQFLPPDVYAHYQHMTALTHAQVPPDDERYKELPPRFSHMMPLDVDSKLRGTTGTSGYMTSVFKALSVDDGLPYAVRRVDNVRRQVLNPDVCRGVVELWKKVGHPSIIPLRDAFVHGSALFFVHHYWPGAQSLRERYLDVPGPVLPERLLWSIVCQLTTAVRRVHSVGLSCRGVHATRVLMTGQMRVRFNGAGIMDVLEADTKKTLAELQAADVLGLGHLMLALATRTPNAAQTPQKAMEFVGGNYSPDLTKLILRLVSVRTTIFEVTSLIAPQLAMELDSVHQHVDALDSHLWRECENGRLMRLMTKMMIVLERGEADGDSAWSEMGDRYVLKLLRDFIFHQVNDVGAPVIDMGHIIESLNKLDVGDSQEVLLSSRDGRSLLVTSFLEARTMLNSSYSELRFRKSAPAVMPGIGGSMAGTGAGVAGMGGRSGAGAGAAGAGVGGGRGGGGLWVAPSAAAAPPFVPGMAAPGGMTAAVGAAPFVPGAGAAMGYGGGHGSGY